MSQYYKINTGSEILKVRVSDHEPNEALRGSSDVELYVKSADNQLISIEAQLERICEKRNYNISDFQIILDEWKDGSYSKDAFKTYEDESENEDAPNNNVTNMKMAFAQSNDEKLKGYIFKEISGSELRAEIKQLSENTGVSQNYIKKFFNISQYQLL